MTQDQTSFISHMEGLLSLLSKEEIKKWLSNYDVIVQDARLVEVILSHILYLIKTNNLNVPPQRSTGMGDGETMGMGMNSIAREGPVHTSLTDMDGN